jgi:8-oxo-dGTP diphosphatase
MDIVKVGLVATDERGRLLVVRKRGGRTFILPGGKPEGDESDLSCLARELLEELGVHMRGAPAYLGTFGAPAADMPGSCVMLRAYRADIHGDPRPLAEIEEMRWIDPQAPDVAIADSIANGVIPALPR